MTRSEMARAESTRDPIFLLQERTWQVADEGAFDRMREIREDHDWTRDEIAALVEEGMLAYDYRTVSVWLSREEAEAFARRTAYRYKHGWLVYCVCAEGELAAVLKRLDEPTPTPAGATPATTEEA